MVLKIVIALLLINSASAMPTQAAERDFSPALPASKNFDPSIGNLPKWERIVDFYDMTNLQSPSKEYRGWWNFIREARKLSPLDQITYVNKTLNKFPYKQDNWIYARDDHWASPSEFLKNGGDCEDYAIIKYMTLRRLGFDADQMKIAIIYDVYSGTDHAYLVVNFGNKNFILDSREDKTDPAYFTKRYQPHYAFSEAGIWHYQTPKIVTKHRPHNSTEALPGNR